MNRYVLDLEKDLEEYKKMVREVKEKLSSMRVTLATECNPKDAVFSTLNAIEDAIIKLEELE